MEIGIPTYQSTSQSYSFRILTSPYKIQETQFYEAQTPFSLPAKIDDSEPFVREFLEKTKKYFTNPLTVEKVLRHLRHSILDQGLPTETGMYEFQWTPYAFVIKSGDFALEWKLVSCKPHDIVIPPEFTQSTTPRNESPVPEQPPLRNIQIHDTLVPVGDLPLSDLPPLSFGTEPLDPAREEIRRRIREARLKVALARLKAQRMEQKYYARYGQQVEESEESSEFSSDSEEDLSLEEASH
jgi:hypothetical protein